MSRQKCEARARALGLVKDEGLMTVEDAVTVGPGPYDTRAWVALSARAPGEPLVGHLYAFGGYVRHCLIFHFASEVASDADEGVLSSRLASARTRILGGVELEPFDVPAREAH